MIKFVTFAVLVGIAASCTSELDYVERGASPPTLFYDDQPPVAAGPEKPAEGPVKIGARKPPVVVGKKTFAGELKDKNGKKWPIRYVGKKPSEVGAAVEALEKGKCMDQDAEILAGDGKTIVPVVLTICKDNDGNVTTEMKYPPPAPPPPPPKGQEEEEGEEDPDYGNSDEYCYTDDCDTDTTTDTSTNTSTAIAL